VGDIGADLLDGVGDGRADLDVLGHCGGEPDGDLPGFVVLAGALLGSRPAVPFVGGLTAEPVVTLPVILPELRVLLAVLSAPGVIAEPVGAGHPDSHEEGRNGRDGQAHGGKGEYPRGGGHGGRPSGPAGGVAGVVSQVPSVPHIAPGPASPRDG